MYAEKLRMIDNKIRSLKYHMQATQFLASLPNANLSPASKEQAATQDLLSNRDSFEAFDQKLIPFPPEFEAVSARPLIFNLASAALEFPSLESRKKPKGSFWSSFWRWDVLIRINQIYHKDKSKNLWIPPNSSHQISIYISKIISKQWDL